jgi:hypothetical protein
VCLGACSDPKVVCANGPVGAIWILERSQFAEDLTNLDIVGDDNGEPQLLFELD